MGASCGIFRSLVDYSVQYISTPIYQIQNIIKLIAVPKKKKKKHNLIEESVMHQIQHITH